MYINLFINFELINEVRYFMTEGESDWPDGLTMMTDVSNQVMRQTVPPMLSKRNLNLKDGMRQNQFIENIVWSELY